MRFKKLWLGDGEASMKWSMTLSPAFIIDAGG